MQKRAPHFKKAHLNAFPAVHLKKMDVWDFVLKFSSELLVLSLAVAVAGLNLSFFAGGSQNGYNDNSFAAGFLQAHADWNQKLADRNSSIITTVSGTGLIAQAQADDFQGLDASTVSPDNTPDNSAAVTVSPDGIQAPNPDSIRALVTNVTKKIYTTQSGDTLQSIAAANGISVNSIKWSNPSLTTAYLKPGWNLIIPPIDGVAVTADANTTLPDLAVQYSPQRYNPDKKARDAAAAQLLDKIISYNGLDSAEDINPGDFLIIPGGVVAAPPAPPKPKPAPKSKTYNSPAISDDTVTSIGSGYDGAEHYFPVGYCTYYVASKMRITFGGNARNWLANARASGYVTGSEAAPHSAVVFSGYGYGKYGHVAYVESVNGNGTITVSEMNYERFNRVDRRTLSVRDPAIRGYIYP